ncbi:MAG: fused MFS/spermidine synthase [Gemmataceae bacterium]|nr:fused MFS/spermidine synthase [Gemmataceae bacterium]
MRFLFSFTIFVGAALLFVVQPMIGKMILPLAGGTPAVWTTCMVFFQAALLGGYYYAHVGTTRLGPRGMAGLHPALLGLPLLLLIATALFAPGGSPLTPIKSLAPHGTDYPFFPLALLLFVLIGLPFFFVATSAPLLQRWFADTDDSAARDPYFLYAASNLGSFLGLILYPAVIERYMPLKQQAFLWAGGFAVWAALTALCAAALKRNPGPAERMTLAEAPPITWPQRLRWIGLSAVPSSLMLSVITVITTDVAPIPLFFVIPLGIYLLTFVVAFGVRAKWIFSLANLALPMLLLGALLIRITPIEGNFPKLIQSIIDLTSAAVGHQIFTEEITCQIMYYLGLFTVIALGCHLALAASRPPAARLTEFFLWVSLGGVLGGLFNAVVAPMIFVEHTELAIGLIAACFCVAPGKKAGGLRELALDLIVPALLFALVFVMLTAFNAGESEAAAGESIFWSAPRSLMSGFRDWLNQRNQLFWYERAKTLLCYGPAVLVAFFCLDRPVRFGLATAAIFFAHTLVTAEVSRRESGSNSTYSLMAGRSFFGTLYVNHTFDSTEGVTYHKLVHGTTVHGLQQVDPKSGEPLSYYHRLGPVGDLFACTPAGKSTRPIAFVGLGSGSLSAYGQPGQSVTFYEIDALIRRLASDPQYFHYVTDAKARGVKLDIIMGDARLRLEEAAPGAYALLAVDAFSSDSIPVHLLTREAIQLYMDKLAPDGVLALHVSNRYLKLDRVVARIAADLGLPAYQCYDGDENAPGKSRSDWIVIAKSESSFGDLLKVVDSSGELRWKSLGVDPKNDAPLWTDDFSNVLDVFGWKR